MADWPSVAAVKQSLGITNDAHDGIVAAAIGAAIEQVAVDVGYRSIEVAEDSPGDGYVLTAALYNVETEVVDDPAEVIPTWSLSQAAHILAVMVCKAPEAPYGIAAAFDLGAVRVASEHPTYQRMLTGHRQRFGVA